MLSVGNFIILKTVPVQNIDTVHLQIFQNTENGSSAKCWYCAFMDIPEQWKLFQCKMLILCIYGYSRTLKTVPVQNVDTVHLHIFQNTENCASVKHWHCTFADTPKNCTKILMNCVLMDILEHWTLYQYAALVFTNTYKWCSYEHVYKH